ncbi:MAG: 3-phosphoserine/phosphohydroxythreonine transaminase [bacterium]|nr:3-phosphoserine/phosphohydroxythreonine transaminase [bacterium]
MANRVFNFNAGPATLPLSVLEKIQQEMLDYRGTGMSIMESSHRAPEFDQINDDTITLVKELLGLDDSYHVLFLGGGASTQFAMLPMNFLPDGKTAAYVDTGAWSSKAIKEAKGLGTVEVVASSKESNFDQIPDLSDIKLDSKAAYLHLTSNNTIFGTQYQSFPDTGNTPLICDMSSDIASRKHDFTKFSMIYAGAQKNLGPSGVTLVLIRDDLLKTGKEDIPIIFRYGTHADKKSLYNTPPCFPIYVLNLVLHWIKDQGGLAAVEKINRAKMERLYQMMDLNPDYFRGTVKTDSRSWMNVTMRLPNEELEKKFIAEAKEAGMVGLKGHRSVGGIRASIYNAFPREGVDHLVAFMEKFKAAN